MGRKPRTVEKVFRSANGKPDRKITVQLFKWEELDKVNEIKKAFAL
jgi:hypothetical protein